jgi:hypothetical protein
MAPDSGSPPAAPSRPVFGRYSSTGHPYDPMLDDCSGCGLPHDMAMAENIRHDHRVSREREEWFDELSGSPRGRRQDLEDGMTDYFKDWIRTRDQDPDYILEKLNGENILVGGIMNRRSFKGTIPLGRVLDLNGLRQPFSVAVQAAVDGLLPGPELERLRRFVEEVRVLNTEEQFGGFLDRQLDERRSGLERQEFLSDLLLALNVAARERPFQPCWVTLWSDLEPHLREDSPEEWAEALGVVLHQADRWLIVLRYTIDDAAMLVRPTQLEAGWWGYHFPSPQHAPVSSGGHPVDLGINDPFAPLVREYIHSRIDYDVRQWIVAGRRLRRTTRATACDLQERRRNHYRRLMETYGEDATRSWMSSP